MNARWARIVLRLALVGLGFVHTLPAQKHLAAFASHPSLTEAWKGFGALLAVAVYLLPLRVYVRALSWLWRHSRIALSAAGWVLALVHLVPASDHVPRFLHEPSFADAWRGIGTASAFAWFLLPLPVQGRAFSALRAAATFTSEGWLMEKVKLAAVVVAGLALGGIAGARAMSERGAITSPPHASARSAQARTSVQSAQARSPLASIEAPASAAALVPHAASAITVDGEFDDEAWTRGAILRTGSFSTRPYSDARIAWRDGTLFFILYAADEDIRTGGASAADAPLADTFAVTFERAEDEYVIRVAPNGMLTKRHVRAGARDDAAWGQGVTVSVDHDGTLDDPDDDDEEWVVELGVPLNALGLVGKPGEQIAVTIERCDASRGAAKTTCHSWGAGGKTIELGP